MRARGARPLGAKSLEDLPEQTVPARIRSKLPLVLVATTSDTAVLATLNALPAVPRCRGLTRRRSVEAAAPVHQLGQCCDILR